MAKPTNASIPLAGGSLALRYTLDEASGNAIDSSGNGHNLTDNNTVSTDASVPVSGFANSRKFIAANSEYFNAADAAWNSPTGKLSIAFWAKLTSRNNAGFVTKYNETGGQNAFITQEISASSKTRFNLQSSGGTTDTQDSATNISTTEWQHWIYVFEPSTRVTLYLNGVQDAELTSSVEANIKDTTSDLYIGAYNSGGVTGFLDGLMQDVIIITGGSLTDTDATDLYNLYFASTATTNTNISTLPLLGVG